MQRPEPNSIPTTPGVYLYKDKGGRIIYVGKALNLRKRVLSYFRPPNQISSKTAAMLNHAESIEFLNTTTEKEALLLEAGLIKKHRPHYNILLRDDKQYVMFRLSMKAAYPRLEIVRNKKLRDGAKYFGPFTSGMAARETWKTIHRIFPLRRCSDRAMKNRSTPCLYHHIKLCSAPCTGCISEQEYADLARRVSLLLSGKSTELVVLLRKYMEEAAERLEFEKAASFRDQIRAIEKTVEKQGIILQSNSDLDALGLVSLPAGLALGVVFVRGGIVQDRTAFFWPGLGMEDASELLVSFLTQFYNAERSIPPRILLPYWPWIEGANIPIYSVDANSAVIAPHASTGPEYLSQKENAGCKASLTPIEQAALMLACSTENTAIPNSETTGIFPEALDEGREALEAALGDLRGGMVHLSLPKNEEERHIMEMARSNARESAQNKRSVPLAESLAKAFHSAIPISRIECADVSHTGGESTKVGMVVYTEGRPHKDEYRVWNIEGANGDDYAALSLWARRRLEHGEPWPDLLLIDGGRGQLSAVESVLRGGFALEDGEALPFLLAGIAKARDERGHADRRAGNVADRIFIPNRSNPLALREGCPELLFLQSVRDSAHDFSIGRHRQARAKHAFSGELRSLPGIGLETTKLLWNHFDSVAEMKNATLEQLLALPTIGKKKAAHILASLKLL